MPHNRFSTKNEWECRMPCSYAPNHSGYVAKPITILWVGCQCTRLIMVNTERERYIYTHVHFLNIDGIYIYTVQIYMHVHIYYIMKVQALELEYQELRKQINQQPLPGRIRGLRRTVGTDPSHLKICSANIDSSFQPTVCYFCLRGFLMTLC